MKYSSQKQSDDILEPTEPRVIADGEINKATGLQRIGIIFFILTCVVGVLLISKYFLVNNSLRLDEAQSLWQTSHTLPGTLKVIAEDVHVPLYHVTLHFWQIFMGQGVESARALSMIFFLLTIPVVYLLARRVLAVKWSLLVVALFSFSPFMNWYANEIRMYTLLVFLATLSQYFFLKLIESRGKVGWLGYTMTALVGVYSHYFFIFNLAAQGIYFLIARKNFVKGTLRKFILLAGLLAAWLAPWIYYFISLGSASNTSPDLARPSSVDLFNVLSQFAFGFQNEKINTILLSMWPIIVIVILLSVKYGQRISAKMAYILAAGLLPFILAFGASYVTSPFFLGRYMVACVAPLIILTVWLVSNYQKKLAAVVSAGLLVLLIGVSVQQYFSPTTPVKEDFRAAANIVEQEASARDVIVLTAPFTVYPFNYYYEGSARVRTIPEWNRVEPGPIPAFNAATLTQEVAAMNKNHQYVFLLRSFDQGYDEEVYQHYQQRFKKVSSRQLSSDLKLDVYRVGYNQLKPLSQAP